ncbi:hypothetical protein [Nocardia sp. NPDC059239]|uniref:DUF7427 family protein n=1 Tax=Nocardia sp. NPDC059239 TaxID=3346785 RepID=UPI0036C2CE62
MAEPAGLRDLRALGLSMATVRGGHALAAFTAAWVAYDVLAAEDEQLTDVARRMHQRHPIGWPVVV